jgi:hypothetical protein
MATDQQDEDKGFDPKRRLCPDGACVGVIGADGKCSVCGTGDDGRLEPTLEAGDSSDEAAFSAEEERETASGDEPSPAGSSFDPKRRLCSDGTCIGVVGGNNRCSVCGKPATT